MEQMEQMAPYLSTEIRDYYINKYQNDICWEQLRKTKRFYGDIPLIVLSAGLQDFVHTKQSQQIWLELHKSYLNLSTNSKHIIAERSTHEIHRIEPELVILAIEEVINSNSGRR